MIISHKQYRTLYSFLVNNCQKKLIKDILYDISSLGGEVSMVKNKNIVVCILLSIITCGIYGIIWFINMTDDAAYVNDDHELSGGKAFLFTLITCRIYGLYWNYKMGKELYEAKCKKGMNASDNSVLYLILAVLGLGIVNYCLIQSDLNDFATVEK